MNKHLFRISVISFSICLAFTHLALSQEKIAKEINETYEVKDNTSIYITNKYGNIDIKNWDKKSVDVKVQIKTIDLSEKQIQDLINLITIEYNLQGNTINFETKFDDKFGQTINRMKSDDKGFEVNYIVNMPHYVSANLTNKYGDIFVDKLSSASKIDVKYGNLKANELSSQEKSPMTEIVMGYSEGSVEKSSWLKLTIKYSKINIEESRALIIVSKYSKVFVERGSSIVTESKYDTYGIGSIANFVTEAAYSNFKFKSIGKKLHAETKYTDVKVGFMPAGFDGIKVINRYGSYNLGVEEGASYNIKGVAKYGNITYPDNGRVNRFQETTELRVEGRVGENEDPSAKVSIDTKYGTVKLKR